MVTIFLRISMKAEESDNETKGQLSGERNSRQDVECMVRVLVL